MGNWDTYAISYENIITLERGISEPGEPREPGDTNDKKDEGCCKVSINISSGPVNIYVCGTEKKVNVP